MASLQIIVFDVCGTACALHRSAAREFLPLPRLWRPPALPRPVAGFFNLSGRAIPVVRLDVLFGLAQNDDDAESALYRHLIVTGGSAHRAEKWPRFSAQNDAPAERRSIGIDPKSGSTFGSDALGTTETTALLVDRVLDVATIDASRLSPVQQADSLNGCVEAEVTWQDRLVHLLTLERILLAEERQALAELGRQAQNRLGEWAVQA